MRRVLTLSLILVGLLIPQVGQAEPLQFLDFSSSKDITSRWEEVKTTRMIQYQEQDVGGQSSVSDLQRRRQIQQDRANEIGITIRGVQQKKIEGQLAHEWEVVLRNNPGLKTPSSIVGTTVGVWLGREFVILKNRDSSWRSRVEGRSRNAWVEYGDLVFKTQVGYFQGRGVNFRLSRHFDLIRTTTAWIYEPQTRSVTTQISHDLAKHVVAAINLGKNQAGTFEEQALVSYSMIF